MISTRYKTGPKEPFHDPQTRKGQAELTELQTRGEFNINDYVKAFGSVLQSIRGANGGGKPKYETFYDPEKEQIVLSKKVTVEDNRDMRSRELMHLGQVFRHGDMLEQEFVEHHDKICEAFPTATKAEAKELEHYKTRDCRNAKLKPLIERYKNDGVSISEFEQSWQQICDQYPLTAEEIAPVEAMKSKAIRDKDVGTDKFSR